MGGRSHDRGRYGALSTSSNPGDPSLRPGLAIHLRSLWPSVSSGSNPRVNGFGWRLLDNALRESFFATLKCELLDRCRFQSHAEARIAIFSFIKGWYNPHRRHSSLDYLSPMAYEKRYTRW